MKSVGESLKTNMNSNNLVVNNTIKKVCAFFVLLSFYFSNPVFSQTYCAAAAVAASDDEIFNVTLGSLTNSSNCSSLGGAGSILNRYNNYTALPAPGLILGTNYPLSVTVGMCGAFPFAYSGRVGVWIDYNQNGLFTDPGENVYMSPYTLFSIAGTSVAPGAGITIPLTANTGITRMRVIEVESATAPGPCTNPPFGEVEDYNVNLLAPTPLDLGVNAILKPLGTTVCYAFDTIVAKVKNYGTSIVDFAVDTTIISVVTSGPNPSTFTLALNQGTIAINGTKNYTVTTAYNMMNMGTYKLKAFTSVPGDGSPFNDTVTKTITKSPYFTKTVFPNDSVCLGQPVQLNANFSSTKQLGTGILQNTSTTYPAPYGNFYMGAKHQFLFLASELTAAGLSAGNITSLAFNVTNLNGSGPYVNFNIAMATTAITNITNFQTTGFSTYFSAASYVPVLGINTHTLSTPYVWDGISNIIIETCFNNNPITWTNNVSVMQSSTPFTSSVWYNADSNPTVCTTASAFNSIAQRPNILFEQPATMTFSWSPAIEISATNIANPIANVSGTRTYTISGTNGGCMTYDTVQIFVKPTPLPNLGNDSLYCNLPVIINANTSASSYLWNNSSIGSSLNVTAPGKYWVRATNANGCTNSDTTLITLGESPIVTLGADTAYCQGSSINLYGGFSPGNTYLWSTGSTASFITVGTSGTYSVLVVNTIGCETTDIINVTSKPVPSVALVFTGLNSFCAADGTARLLTEGVPSGGAYIGAGVNSSTFFPAQAGQGNHIILYNYTGPNGCSNIARDTLFVRPCVGIEEFTDNINLSIYPNPTTGSFVMEINSINEFDGKISITSIDGKLVFTDIVSGNGLINKTINISDLANGIYYLKMESTSTARTYKILKQ